MRCEYGPCLLNQKLVVASFLYYNNLPLGLYTDSFTQEMINVKWLFTDLIYESCSWQPFPAKSN